MRISQHADLMFRVNFAYCQSGTYLREYYRRILKITRSRLIGLFCKQKVVAKVLEALNIIANIY